MAGGAAVTGGLTALTDLGHHRNAMPNGKVAHLALCRVPLGGSCSLGKAGSNYQAVAIFHQSMPYEAELGRFAFALPEQPGLGVVVEA
jgi:hypothetical protein